jgi:hypothetical protein
MYRKAARYNKKPARCCAGDGSRMAGTTNLGPGRKDRLCRFFEDAGRFR